MYEFAIVGLGPAGIFVLASLPSASTIVFEPHAVCGNLALYGSIKANLTKQEILSAFRRLPRWQNLQVTHLASYADTECPLLADVCEQMRDWILPDLQKTTYVTKRITNLVQAADHWNLETETQVFEAQKVMLCVGSQPKVLDLPKPTLPLYACLNPVILQTRVSPDDAIVVIGTAHSGTLIMNNLKNMNCSNVVGIYRDTPFHYARDGYVGGIKQESAHIADAILSHAWESLTPTLIDSKDIAATYRAIEKSKLVLYACGFNPSQSTYIDTSGNTHILNLSSNAQFENLPNLWGFGYAFPSKKGGKPDIGFLGFIEAIMNALPAILE
jgi:hypothetical protein